jgi:hypothetical protein
MIRMKNRNKKIKRQKLKIRIRIKEITIMNKKKNSKKVFKTLKSKTNQIKRMKFKMNKMKFKIMYKKIQPNNNRMRINKIYDFNYFT